MLPPACPRMCAAMCIRSVSRTDVRGGDFGGGGSRSAAPSENLTKLLVHAMSAYHIAESACPGLITPREYCASYSQLMFGRSFGWSSRLPEIPTADWPCLHLIRRKLHCQHEQESQTHRHHRPLEIEDQQARFLKRTIQEIRNCEGIENPGVAYGKIHLHLVVGVPRELGTCISAKMSQ